MKIKLLLSIAVLFFVGLFAIPGYSQTQMISISNLKYTNGAAIPNGTSIKIAEGGTVYVTFDLSINNPQMALIKGGTLSVYSKLNSNSNIQHVSINFGQNAITGTVIRQCTIDLRSTHFPTGTGSIYAQFSPINNSPITGTSVPVKVVPLITSNYIIGNQTVYEGDSVGSINGPVPNGGDGLYTYSWEQRIGSGGSWTTIPGATGVTYKPVNVSASTISYRRIVTSLFGTLTSTSNEITVTILANLPIQNNEITLNGSTISGSLPTGGIGSFTYKWFAYIVEGEGWSMMQATTKDLSIPAYIYGFAENLTNSQVLIYREVWSGNKFSSSKVVRVSAAQPIENNTITVSGQNIIGSLPTGGNGDFKYDYYLYQYDGNGEIIEVYNVGNDQHFTLANYGGLITKIYRKVTSANKVSSSNTITISPIVGFAKMGDLKTQEINSSDLTVYPNPTSESVNFSTNFSTNKEIEIVVYSDKMQNENQFLKEQ